MLNPRFCTLAGIVLAGAAMRLMPHPPNFTPIAAIALFGGAHFAKGRTAFAVPLAAMFASDLVLSGGYHAMMPVVYACFVAIVGLGLLIRRRRSPLTIGVAAIASSVLFFVVTNFGVWVVFTLYPKTLGGLIACYIAALPYFRNTLAGDMAFTVLFFGSFAVAERYVSALREQDGPAPVHA